MPRPTSTLFPYTTLFRSTMKASTARWTRNYAATARAPCGSATASSPSPAWCCSRSEERVSRNAETDIYTLSLHDALPIYNESFYREVDEELRRDRARTMWQRYGKLAIAGVVLFKIGRAGQQECRDRHLHSFPTRRSSDLQ